jgi:hypothetical protein
MALDRELRLRTVHPDTGKIDLAISVGELIDAIVAELTNDRAFIGAVIAATAEMTLEKK